MSDLDLATLDEIKDELQKRYKNGILIVEADDKTSGDTICTYKSWGSSFTNLGLMDVTRKGLLDSRFEALE